MNTFMSFIFDEAPVRIHKDEKGMLWFAAAETGSPLDQAHLTI